MKHILFIDPIEKLSPKKDSSIMLAVTMKKAGLEVYFLFEKDFYVSNKDQMKFDVYDFNGEFEEDGCYVKNFKITTSQSIELSTQDVLHMRIDPPFDTRYLRYLWMLRFYQEKGIKVVNSPDGILKYNEKLYAYAQASSLASYVGSSESAFAIFLDSIRSANQEIILKPLDLFQGLGVEKLRIDDPLLMDKFRQKVIDNNGAIVCQPFCKDVVNGEIRSLYFKGEELGSILKVPKKGEYLANIAQGAAFHAVSLTESVKDECDKICADLMRDGVDWVAFDIMGESVSEVNITCPGLLVEVSFAHKKNLALAIINKL